MITPMKKVLLVTLKSEREKVLEALQHSEIIMLTPSQSGNFGEDFESGAKERKLDLLLNDLKKYSKKPSLFTEKPEVAEEKFGEIDPISSEKVSLLSEKVKLRDTLESEISDINSKLLELSEYSTFTGDLSLIGESNFTLTLLGKIPTSNIPLIKENEQLALEEFSSDAKMSVVSVTFLKEDSHYVTTALRELKFEESALPVNSGTVKDETERLTVLLNSKKEEYKNNIEELSSLSNESKESLELYFEQLRAKRERSEVRLEETEETVVFEGFIKSDDEKRLEKVLTSVTDVFALDVYEPDPDEEVPTALSNSKIVSDFEGITNMFNSPKHDEIDPNPVMAPWYWIIFGMMMGDAGYGLMMAVLIFLFKKIMKPKGETKKLMNVLLYSSITTVFFGVLFGSYFGEELLPAVIGFTALDDPISMLIITLIVGVLHIFTGMITKMYIDIKSGHFLDAVFDQLSWMFIILGLGMVFLPSLSKVGIVLAVIGAVTVLLTAGRKKKGFFGKIAGGLGGLYNVTSYLSDILSYSRILALSLATGVIGYVMNLLASMVQGNIIGFVISLVIYIVGHIFNLVLGLLSAYVHSCRLQYIEFYSKFYEGGGTLFKPFKIKTNYINIKKD